MGESADDRAVHDVRDDAHQRRADAVVPHHESGRLHEGDAGNVAENSPRLQHPSDIESTERAIAAESTVGLARRHPDVLEEGA